MSVATIVKCGDVELKITLGSKHLQNTLHASLLVPFIGAYNKKNTAEPALEWEHVKCVQVDGFTIYNVMGPTKSVLKTDRPVVRLITSLERTLTSEFLRKAKLQEEHLGPKAVQAAHESANIDDRPPDEDLGRR